MWPFDHAHRVSLRPLQSQRPVCIRGAQVARLARPFFAPENLPPLLSVTTLRACPPPGILGLPCCACRAAGRSRSRCSPSCSTAANPSAGTACPTKLSKAAGARIICACGWLRRRATWSFPRPRTPRRSPPPRPCATTSPAPSTRTKTPCRGAAIRTSRAASPPARACASCASLSARRCSASCAAPRSRSCRSSVCSNCLPFATDAPSRPTMRRGVACPPGKNSPS